MYSSGVKDLAVRLPSFPFTTAAMRAPGRNRERKRSQSRLPGGPEITSYVAARIASGVATSAGLAAVGLARAWEVSDCVCGWAFDSVWFCARAAATAKLTTRTRTAANFETNIKSSGGSPHVHVQPQATAQELK